MAVDAPHVQRQPRIGDAAVISPLRREIIANRIASWFDRGERGGVRAIDIAAQLKIPLEVMHDKRTRALLEARGIATLHVPGLRYVFHYRQLDGMPDGAALLTRWRSIEEQSIKTSDDGRSAYDHGYALHRSTQELARRVHRFLAANAGREFTYTPLNNAIGGFSTVTLRRPQMEQMLQDLGVVIRYRGTPGENGSRRFYSVPK